MQKPDPWYTIYMEFSDFVAGMLKLGRPYVYQLDLIGDFEYSEGYRQNQGGIEYHRDGVQGYVGLYCLESNPKCYTTIKDAKTQRCSKVALQSGQALIFNDRLVQHGRQGMTTNRLLVRMKVEG